MSPRPARDSNDESIDERRRELTDQIAALGPALPGLFIRPSSCGNRRCTCQADTDQPVAYWIWIRGVGGKTITRALSAEQAERYRPWLDNTVRLRDLVDQLEQLAIEQFKDDDQRPIT